MQGNQEIKIVRRRRAALLACLVYIMLVSLNIVAFTFVRNSVWILVGIASSIWTCFYLSAMVYKWILKGMK